MDKKFALLAGLELVWWGITGLIAMAVLYPINKSIYQFHFTALNIAFVVAFVTLIRYTFLWEYVLWSKKQIVKAALMMLALLLMLYLIKGLNGFMGFLEDNTWEPLTGHLPTGSDTKANIQKYIWAEMLFFGVGSIIACLAFMFRMLVSIWRTHNTTDTV